jgi:peroxiredoxin Q/BCP
LGISFDSKKILKKFKEKHNLPFNFLSDFNKEVGSVYGANKYYFFPSRMTFLIDEKGRVVHIFDEVDLYSHPKDILRFFNQAIKE